MPPKRVLPQQAKVWMLSLYPIAIMVSVRLGGLRQCLALVFLGVWYNDFGGADAHCFHRNLANASGYICYGSGAIEVALGSPLPISNLVFSWFLVIAAAVFTSVHSQDMVGDQLRGRKSVPLATEDAPSRWTIATSVSAFSIFCPMFWGLGLLGYLGPCTQGALVAVRYIRKRLVAEDKVTLRLWNLWMAGQPSIVCS